MDWVDKARDGVKTARVNLVKAKQLSNTGDTPEERMERWMDYNEARWELGMACQRLLEANYYHDLSEEKQKIMSELLTTTVLKMDAVESKIRLDQAIMRLEKAKIKATEAGLSGEILW